MSALSIQPPYPAFAGADGLPLENGYIWIGTTNLNPITNPINVYWDAALTVAAVQPIRTLAGYPVYQGTPARLYVNSDYSIQVQNRNGSVVYSAPAATEAFGDLINANQVVYDPAGTGAVATTVQAKLRESVSVFDFMSAAQVADVQAGTALVDVTAAIQAAIDAVAINANLGKLRVPAGTYKITSTIVIDYAGPLVIEGDAGNVTTVSGGVDKAGSTRFQNSTAGGTMFRLSNSITVGLNVSANVTFIDCGFQNGLNAANIAVEDNKGYDKTTFIRCSFVGGSKGYVNTLAFNVKFEDCDFHGCTYGMYSVVIVDSLNVTLWRCNFRYCGNAVYATTGNSYHFYNCLFEACTGHAVYLDGVFNNHFIYSHWEQNGGTAGTNYDVYILGSVNTPKVTSMIGCTLTRDTITAPTFPQMVQVQIASTSRGMFLHNQFIGTGGATASIRWAAPGGTRFTALGNSLDNPIVDTGNQGFQYTEGTWTPTFVGLTVVNGTGGATYSGTWIKTGNVVDFTATIDVTGTCTTASTSPGTYISNMPFTPLQLGWQACTAINQTDIAVLGQGIVRGSGINVIHTPTWGALNKRITISGTYISVMAS